MTDFIEVYPNALDAAVCRSIIDRFEASGQAEPGRVGGGVDASLKDSRDITISGRPEWEDVHKTLLRAAVGGLSQYVRKHPFAMVGALSLRFQDPASGQPTLITRDNLASIPDAQFLNMLCRVFRSGTINLQKYLAGRGGYPYWHSEIYPLEPHAESLHRVLLYSFYLNDVPEAGETEFFHQERRIKPQTGTLLIAPAGFTHTHRGNTPIGGDKYIATSWFLFQRAEALYGRPAGT